jgi:hypothetical protein
MVFVIPGCLAVFEVKMVKYPPPKIVVFHDNEGVTLP